MYIQQSVDRLKAAFVFYFSQQRQNKSNKSWSDSVFSAQKRRHAYQEGQKSASASSLCDAANTVTMAPHTRCATILGPPSLPPSLCLPLIHNHKSSLNCAAWSAFSLSLWSYGFCPRQTSRLGWSWGICSQKLIQVAFSPPWWNHGIKTTLTHTPPLIQLIEMFAVAECVRILTMGC